MPRRPATIMKIQISDQKIPIRKGSFGISLNDVNYAFDGGLYAELIENRNFEAEEVSVRGGSLFATASGSYGWTPLGACAIKVKTDRPLHTENPHYLRIETSGEGAGVENASYGGMALERGREYRLSFLLRSFDYKGAVLAGVYDGDVPCFEKKIGIAADGKWRRYFLRFKCKADGFGKFRFVLLKAGTVHVDSFSLMPAYAVLGCMRSDLVALMSELKPSYLRFAAGGVGGSWKDSVGDVELRRYHRNPWAARSPAFSHYGNTQGVGVLECLRLAEYLRANPVPVLDMGAASDPESDFETCLQDALDLIEFAKGTDGLWGNLRAELGHAASFALDTLEVAYRPGERPGAVAERFHRFSAGIHALYPDIKLVPPQRPLFLRPAALYHNVTLYDALPRENAVALTEFAALGNAPARNCWEGALAEAAFLTGAERNADIVTMKSYAPFFARLGYAQWSPALVWFDARKAYGSASYHVQTLYARYTGEWAMKAETDEEFTYATASAGDGYVYVKVVNASEKELEAVVAGEELGSLTRVIRMCADLAEDNTAEDPYRVVPRDVAPAAPRSAVLPPHSFSVLVFRK